LRASGRLAAFTLEQPARGVPAAPKADGAARPSPNPGPATPAGAGQPPKGDTFAQLGAGSGVSTSTAWRYVQEAVTLLSARSPKLAAALRKARQGGLHPLVPGGTPIAPARGRGDRAHYSARPRRPGMNVPVS